MICISKAIHKGKRLIEIIIDHAHNIIGHFGQFKTSQYIRRYFWWQSMSHDIESYCKMCGICATSKDANSCWGTYAYMHICTKSIQIDFGIFFNFILVLLSFHCSHTVPIFSEFFPIFLAILFTS